ncbi:transposase [Gimesia sp.]|uniref:transposase n=1 Tax=Gimesia sp. TaxID=2024833 RepID=UPI003A94B0E8
MPTKRHSYEQIISKPREAEVNLAQGMTIPQMCKKLGIHQQTYYQWRREYGRFKMHLRKRLSISNESKSNDQVDRADGQACSSSDSRTQRISFGGFCPKFCYLAIFEHVVIVESGSLQLIHFLSSTSRTVS